MGLAMSRMRFRIRTVMIAIAAIAAILGGVQALERAGFTCWGRIESPNIVIEIVTPEAAYFEHTLYIVEIPMIVVIGLVVVALELLALPICYRYVHRRRSQISAPANRPIRRPLPGPKRGGRESVS
jgi:hypothetical protein